MHLYIQLFVLGSEVGTGLQSGKSADHVAALQNVKRSAEPFSCVAVLQMVSMLNLFLRWFLLRLMLCLSNVHYRRVQPAD